MSWYRLELGDALLAEAELDDIRRRCKRAFERIGAPPGWAVYRVHVSGNLHCKAQLFFSPAAAELARRMGAQCCGMPPKGMHLLAGDETGLFD